MEFLPSEDKRWLTLRTGLTRIPPLKTLVPGDKRRLTLTFEGDKLRGIFNYFFKGKTNEGVFSLKF